MYLFLFAAAKLFLVHDMTMYATVSALNSVGLETFQFSNKIKVDTSPPLPGIVVELSQAHLIDGNKQPDAESIICQTASGTFNTNYQKQNKNKIRKSRKEIFRKKYTNYEYSVTTFCLFAFTIRLMYCKSKNFKMC